ncbi:hypothetical protein F3Y22_tig00117047pilonHSYRG00137 [Hibiscus syriacus]|uniref:Bet v I/Major latex protein domain-containing protein n=1 Tax=Hibiscus syriacus TaxID=106335 RepID=A0A6A2WCG9_HIBSY|nr:hypothetical protein F3Y22_tig00117047pilonHSYRG00137 [Hibiscus syriacus]
MAQFRKMDCQLMVKTSADKFYDTFRKKAKLTPKMSDGFVADVKLLQGDWNSVGAVRLWTYDFEEGKAKTVKHVVDYDHDNKSIVFTMLEGDLMEEYKSFVVTIQTLPKKDGKGCVAHWIVEYERLHEGIGHP